MLNILGLTLAFIGSFVNLVTVMTSKYKKEGITYGELQNLGNEFRNQKLASISGFGLMMIGFFLQILAAYQNL
ncbi:MAG TPA: hypothetical protein DDY89_04365 [Lysinibacillus sp.]|nr:hypothetical protein [Lysinibacillus sp.]